MALSIQPDPHITSVNGFNRDRYRIIPCSDDNRLPYFSCNYQHTSISNNACDTNFTFSSEMIASSVLIRMPHFYSCTSLSVCSTCVKYGMQYKPFVSKP